MLISIGKLKEYKLTNPLLLIASKEFHDGFRNRWVLSLSCIFALMAIGISYFGASASGQTGFSPLPSTMISLATLSAFLIPLISLILAYDSVVGEDEQGTLLLMMTYPVQRWQFLCGKMLGHNLILACATIIGFSLSAIITGIFSDSSNWTELFHAYGIFTAFSLVLAWIFVAIAYVISVNTAEKSKAAGVALLVWFAFVLMFDLVLLGVLVSTQGNVNDQIFPYFLLLNPIDIFRISILQSFADSDLTGLMSIAQHANLSMTTLLCGLVVWLMAPVSYAVFKFSRRTL